MSRDRELGVPKLDPDKVARLPRWAQEALSALDQRLRESWARVDELNGSAAPTRTFAVDYSHGPQYLREGAAVRFVVDPDDRNERGWIEAKLRDGRVEVTGGRALNLRPWVTNVVHVDLGDDR